MNGQKIRCCIVPLGQPFHDPLPTCPFWVPAYLLPRKQNGKRTVEVHLQDLPKFTACVCCQRPTLPLNGRSVQKYLSMLTWFPSARPDNHRFLFANGMNLVIDMAGEDICTRTIHLPGCRGNRWPRFPCSAYKNIPYTLVKISCIVSYWTCPSSDHLLDEPTTPGSWLLDLCGHRSSSVGEKFYRSTVRRFI